MSLEDKRRFTQHFENQRVRGQEGHTAAQEEGQRGLVDGGVGLGPAGSGLRSGLRECGLLRLWPGLRVGLKPFVCSWAGREWQWQAKPRSHPWAPLPKTLCATCWEHTDGQDGSQHLKELPYVGDTGAHGVHKDLFSEKS